MTNVARRGFRISRSFPVAARFLTASSRAGPTASRSVKARLAAVMDSQDPASAICCRTSLGFIARRDASPVLLPSDLRA